MYIDVVEILEPIKIKRRGHEKQSSWINASYIYMSLSVTDSSLLVSGSLRFN